MILSSSWKVTISDFGGLTRKESTALAAGMNARGSTEVVVATIGLSMGVLSQTLFTMIVAMAVITYGTRTAGLILAKRLALRGRAKAAFDAIPPAVLIAVIAPTALATGWAETAAAAITMVAALRLPLLATIAVGVAAVVLLRALF